MPTRRAVLRSGIYTGAALALPGCAAVANDPVPAIGIADFQGDLITPGQRRYDQARAVYWREPIADQHPAVIARCADTADVTRCIEAARSRSSRARIIALPRCRLIVSSGRAR